MITRSSSTSLLFKDLAAMPKIVNGFLPSYETSHLGLNFI